MSNNQNPVIKDQPAANSVLAVGILAFAAFVIVTTEYLIVGLLPLLSRDLAISISAAGQLVTLFALTVMLSGPVLTAWLSGIDRKRLFVAILLIFAASNGLAASATNIWILGLARIVPALALPVFWGTASETAAQMAGPGKAGQAVSNVYLGISAALLFGIPLGTLASDALGWRGAFGVLSLLSLMTAILLAWAMPPVKAPARLNFAQQARLFKDKFFIANVLLSILAFTATFSAYTYLADLLERIGHVAPARVGWWLMGFGGVGLAGNWLGGKIAEKNPLSATSIFLGLLGVATALVVPFAAVSWAFVLCLAVWGIAYTALFPVRQVRVMKSAAHSQALAGTVNVSAANAGIAVGAVAGGIAIPAWGIGSIGYVATGFSIFALLSVPLVKRWRPAS